MAAYWFMAGVQYWFPMIMMKSCPTVWQRKESTTRQCSSWGQSMQESLHSGIVPFAHLSKMASSCSESSSAVLVAFLSVIPKRLLKPWVKRLLILESFLEAILSQEERRICKSVPEESCCLFSCFGFSWFGSLGKCPTGSPAVFWL